MRLDKKLFQYLKPKSLKDEIWYSNKSLQKSKKERKALTEKRGINNPQYKTFPIPSNVLPPEINNSIETLPLWYWWEIQRTGNVKLLDINKSKDKSYKFLFYCAASWDDMQDQHINEFGIPKEFHDKTKAKSKYAEAKAKHAVSQDNWDLFLMDIAKGELDSLESTGKQVSNYKTKGRIEAALKCGRIDPRVITVIEYYHLMEDASETNRDGGRT